MREPLYKPIRSNSWIPIWNVSSNLAPPCLVSLLPARHTPLHSHPNDIDKVSLLVSSERPCERCKTVLCFVYCMMYEAPLVKSVPRPPRAISKM